MSISISLSVGIVAVRLPCPELELIANARRIILVLTERRNLAEAERLIERDGRTLLAAGLKHKAGIPERLRTRDQVRKHGSRNSLTPVPWTLSAPI